jgi:hypothetical protein
MQQDAGAPFVDLPEFIKGVLFLDDHPVTTNTRIYALVDAAGVSYQAIIMAAEVLCYRVVLDWGNEHLRAPRAPTTWQA